MSSDCGKLWPRPSNRSWSNRFAVVEGPLIQKLTQSVKTMWSNVMWESASPLEDVNPATFSVAPVR